MSRNILITGEPNTGRSKLLQVVLSEIPENNRRGFVTAQLPGELYTRNGFKIIRDDRAVQVIANIYLASLCRVDGCGVDIPGFESAIDPLFHYGENNHMYIDEIGQMQLTSERFRELVLNYLNAQNPFLATISKVYSNDFTEEIKRRSDVTLIELTKDNRDKVYGSVVGMLEEFTPKIT